PAPDEASAQQPLCAFLPPGICAWHAIIRPAQSPPRMYASSFPPGPLFDPHERVVPPAVLDRLAAFSEAWRGRPGREEQLSQAFLLELCDALGVARPTGTSSRPFYAFEHPVKFPGTTQRGKIDLYKEGCFVLEAKCGRASAQEAGSAPVRG